MAIKSTINEDQRFCQRETLQDDLHRLRIKLKLSQQGLADLLLTSRWSVSQWECGRQVPRPLTRELLRKLSDGPDFCPNIPMARGRLSETETRADEWEETAGEAAAMVRVIEGGTAKRPKLGFVENYDKQLRKPSRQWKERWADYYRRLSEWEKRERESGRRTEKRELR